MGRGGLLLESPQRLQGLSRPGSSGLLASLLPWGCQAPASLTASFEVTESLEKGKIVSDSSDNGSKILHKNSVLFFFFFFYKCLKYTFTNVIIP